MRLGAVTTFNAATVAPCALRKGTASACTPSSCSSLLKQKSSCRTCAISPRNTLGSVTVKGVIRANVRPFIQALKTVLDLAASSTRPVDVACAGKRAPMGTAALLADHLIVTSDNPRSEDPADIIAQIIAGAEPAGTKLQVIEDRASAILHAIRHAGKNDVVLVAGKGHEDYQEVKGRRLAFRDADHAALALATRATRNGGH